MEVPHSVVGSLAQAENEKTARLFARMFIVGGVTTGIASLFDSSSELFTPWDDYLTAITSTLLLVSGLIIHLRPRWIAQAALLSIIPSAVYQQGVMFLAVHYPSAGSLYSAASAGPFFPLIFVILFITLPKGGAMLSWIHCAGFYIQFLLNHFWLSAPQPTAGRAEAEHLLVEAMMAYPIYIVALTYIVNLRERLHAASEEAFKHKENFLGMLSHEIRNQLQTMVGAIELLDFKLKDAVERRSLRRLQSATTQLQTYLGDINELTRLENPTLKMERKVFVLEQLLDDIRDEWSGQALNHGLQLVTIMQDTDSVQPMRVDTDETRLRQIISNLVSNSIKYTNSGSVTVSAGASLESPGCVTVEVSDTGVGIDAKHLDKIFLPHVRLEDATGKRAEGSGLGLTIVERLVASLGGSLRVDSRPGHGTKFEVTMPGLVEAR